MIENLNIDELFNDSLNTIQNFLYDCKLKKFRRKFRRNSKITYTKYLITYNPVRDLILDNLFFDLKLTNRLLNRK